MLFDAEPVAESRVAERASLAAFAFVVLALVALAALPALMLQRVSRTNDELTEVLLPAYDAVNEFTVAMEQRTIVARSELLRGGTAYSAAYQAAMRREGAALGTLARLSPSLSPSFERDFARLRSFVARRDTLAVLAVVMGGPLREEYVPEFDALRDSLLLTASRLQGDLRESTRERTLAEARWIERQQLIAAGLGLVTLFAVFAVGRFAMVQRRLRGEVQDALATAERLRADAEAQQAELARITESRNKLLRGFTHDVKNPLGAAAGYLDLLSDGIQGPLSDAQLRSIGRARASIASALGLVEELLELARTEGGHLEVFPAPTDLRELVTDVAEESRPLAEAKGLTLELALDGAPEQLITDGRRVRQVLGNLLSNAIKYTAEGGVTLRVVTLPEGRVGIAVVDTGPGIPPDKQALLGREFVRLNPGGRSGGAGVGLTISHRIARALGGEIGVESAVGRGSTFTLWLPS